MQPQGCQHLIRMLVEWTLPFRYQINALFMTHKLPEPLQDCGSLHNCVGPRHSKIRVRTSKRFVTWVVALLSLSVCGQSISARTAENYEVVDVVTDLKVPWGLVWLPDGDMLVSERAGTILRIRDGSVVGEIEGVPEVHNNSQGGLMDLELHPDFEENNWLYFSYASQEGEGNGSNTAIARARLAGDTLKDYELLYKASPNTRGVRHYGSRLEFDRNGYLYFSVGDRGNRDRNPQDLARDGGKVYRIHDDGRIPENNPFLELVRPAVYSGGHRNPQGMAMHPKTGEIWIHEHGPRGGDEVNIVRAGQNYGWPILSHGINYDGTGFAKSKTRKGYQSPIWYWVPSIAPSGMAFVTSDLYPEWQDHLLVGSLKFGYLVLCKLERNKVTHAIPVVRSIGRVRNVRQGPDGMIYVAIDGQGIKRIEPKS